MVPRHVARCVLRDVIPITSCQENNSSYRGADESLARPGRKQANVYFRMA